MRQLSYSDRKGILSLVDQLRQLSLPGDRELMQSVTRFFREHREATGFEHALIRDAVSLCNHLRLSTNNHIRHTARAGLLYLVERDDHFPDDLPDLGLQDDAYVLGLALHEIQQLSGINESYSGPDLSAAEKNQVRSMLSDLLRQPVYPDAEIIEHAASFCRQIRSLAESGFFGRMIRNAQRLVGVLNESADSAARGWARAALNYLMLPADVIPDDLGLIGYIDDAFALETAMRSIRADHDPWIDVINDVTRQWPFLNHIVVSEEGCRSTLSEFILANSMVTARLTDGSGELTGAGIVLPFGGPEPFLIAFLCALNVIRESATSNGQYSYTPGQRVLLDGTTVATFECFEDRSERKGFKLCQTGRGTKRIARSACWYPIEALARVRPADPDRSDKGSLYNKVASGEAKLSSVDRILHTEIPIQLAGFDRRVLLVTPAGEARQLASSLSIYGQLLREVIPMGHLTVTREITSWSLSWGSCPPLLLVAPNVDVAAEFLDGDDRSTVCAVIVNSGNSVARQAASFRRICKHRVPTVVLTRYRDLDDRALLDKLQIPTLDWNRDDIRDLQLPAARLSGQGKLSHQAQRLKSWSASRVELQQIENEHSAKGFSVLQALEKEAKSREQPLDELEGFIATAWGIFLMFCRAVAPLQLNERDNSTIQNRLSQLNNAVADSGFMSREERSLACRLLDVLAGFASTLQSSTPKADYLQKLASERSSVIIICDNDEFAAPLAVMLRTDPAFDGAENVFVEVLGSDDEPEYNGTVVVPGWYGKRRMSRLLHPPVAEDEVLLLYDVEARWYQGFCARSRGGASDRISDRNRLLGGSHWSARELSPPQPSSAAILDWKAYQDIDRSARDTVIKRVVENARRAHAGEEVVPARTMFFADGSYGFFTDGFTANVVTHLIDGSVDAESTDAAVRTLDRDSVRPGDYLLFYRRAGSDVIRHTADEQFLKTPAVRKDASLWQKALLRYRSGSLCSVGHLQRKLREAGCRRSEVAIRGWLNNLEMIGPRSHEADVEAIAEITGDEELGAHLGRCVAAISRIKSAHLKASYFLARRVIDRVAGAISDRKTYSPGARLDVDESVIAVQVADIDQDDVEVPRHTTNHLLEEFEWQE